MDINFLISTFEQEYIEEDFDKKEELRKQFVSEFPLENIKDMDLEQFALGKRQGSLSWWLEYKTTELGSIKGGSAHKHKIFFSVKENKWIYPKDFGNETEAWLKLRKELYEFLKKFETTGYYNIDEDNIIYSMNMVRGKLLYMYYSDKVLPIYSTAHLQKILEYFGYERNDIKDWDSVRANIELKKVQESHKIFKNWSPFKFMRFAYNTIIHDSKIYKIAPGEDAKYWKDCVENNYICIGWDDIGDMRNYADYNEFKHKFAEIYDYDKSKTTQKSNEMWSFFSLNAGDIIVANKGTNTIMGIGEVSDKGYEYDVSRDEFKHIVYVNWKKDFDPKQIEPQNYWAFRTVLNITEKLYKNIIGEETKPTDTGNVVSTPPVVIDDVFTEEEEMFYIQIDKNLNRKGNIILYGPPGTGKTYLSSRYLKWKFKSSSNGVIKEFCTFHPSFNYEDFIEGYKPSSNGKGDISFTLKDGIFKEICNKAKADKNSNYYLIIDEINRGNVEKIFGEMITLIEKDKRGMSLTLSQSQETFYVPENVYIIGTMNTTDKSIKMLDAALRRRFAFIECMPNYEIINKPIDNLGLSPKEILMKINLKLREIEDREKQIGHSYFMKNGKQIDTLSELKEVYIYDIIPLISEYCFNDYSKMSEIIGEKFIDEDSEELKYELINGNEDYFAAEILNNFGEKND
ncbi:McrB family protein [Clostridium sp. JS66]|uniref:McrB family protein n=1 Tax=Clostridium sp. JS66 TaxID=3064705 RepID=UPI00298E1968|nr:AAA family ATPase [Clostridium sp. JS66]WPC40060.1 AAA family ATPase [Clostridium sp. JS66]